MHGPNLFEENGTQWVLQRFLVEWLNRETPGWAFEEKYKAAGTLTFASEQHLRKFRQAKMWVQRQPIISQTLGQNTNGNPCYRPGDPYAFLLIAADEFAKKSDLGNGWFSSPPAIVAAKLRRLHERLHGLVDM